MALNLSEVIELKKLVEEQFAVQLHFHDSCGGQSFSVDEPISRELEAILRTYFEKKRGQIRIAEDRHQFRVE